MKIGILTYHAVYNFGANLQAYANQTYLKMLGHDVYILDYRRNLVHQEYGHVPRIQADAHEAFVSREFQLTSRCYTREDLKKCCIEQQFDLIIVGSDAVWSIPGGWDFKKDGLPVFFMDWLFEEPQLVSTAVASISVAHMGNGFKHLDADIRAKLAHSIRKFSVVNVRDRWTQAAVIDLVGKKQKIHISADPVFSLYTVPGLLDSKKEKNLLISPLNESFFAPWLQDFKKCVNDCGLSLVELPIPDKISGLDVDGVVSFPLDPLDWFRAIANSEAFIGIRFHAIVSSITCSVPFFSVDSYGSRFFFVRAFNRLKFPVLGRMFDYKSKIYQLLKGSGFEAMRTNGFRSLTAIPPKKILDGLLLADKKKIQNLRDKNFTSYADGISRILAKKFD